MYRHVLDCDFKEAIASLTGEAMGQPRWRPQLAAVPLDEAPETTTTADTMSVWNASVDPRGTIAGNVYLPSRSLVLGDDVAGSVLRWHPGIGALVALFRNIRTGEPQGVSRIMLDREGRNRLKPDGQKMKLFLGPVGGAAVMLDPFESVLGGRLHIGEGVETCLAARQLGLRPCWALGSTSGIGTFLIIDNVRSLTLLEENDGDDKGKSKDACEVAAARWHAAGR